jgi:hypothetical protein
MEAEVVEVLWRMRAVVVALVPKVARKLLPVVVAVV